MDITVKVTNDAIANATCSMIEGGYSPWVGKLTILSSVKGFGDTPYAEAPFYATAYRIGVRHDGAKSSEKGWDVLSFVGPEHMKRGLTKMARNSPKHFGDLIGDGGDAITGDVLWQYVLLGEILFG